MDGLRKVGDGLWMDCGGLVGQASCGVGRHRICGRPMREEIA